MGKTYKDKDKLDLPRVPAWARPKPTKPHGGKKREEHEDKNSDWIREEWENA
jgi:hypothetical protein